MTEAEIRADERAKALEEAEEIADVLLAAGYRRIPEGWTLVQEAALVEAKEALSLARLYVETDYSPGPEELGRDVDTIISAIAGLASPKPDDTP